MLNFDLFDDDIEIFRSKKKFSLENSVARIDDINLFPDEGESIRIVSPVCGFSSCSVILKLCREKPIKEMYISTLRVGKKEINALNGEYLIGNIQKVIFTLSGISKEHDKKYGYTDEFESICKENGWGFTYSRNHSKLILIDFGDKKLVVETSSNLNENPKIEQFCITNSVKLYEFYLKEMQKNGVWKC